MKPDEFTKSLGEAFARVHPTEVRVNPIDCSFHYIDYTGIHYIMLLRKAEE